MIQLIEWKYRAKIFENNFKKNFPNINEKISHFSCDEDKLILININVNVGDAFHFFWLNLLDNLEYCSNKDLFFDNFF